MISGAGCAVEHGQSFHANRLQNRGLQSLPWFGIFEVFVARGRRRPLLPSPEKNFFIVTIGKQLVNRQFPGKTMPLEEISFTGR
jgi:hypothetical protein